MQLCTAPAPNAFSFKVPIPSRLHLDTWHHLLSDFSDNVICEFLELGWPINYTSSTPPTLVSHNHPSACNHPDDVHQFIAKEVQLQATIGPFSVTPFSCNFMTSPLLTVPKKDFTSHCIVMDLSFPLGTSVNDGIPKRHFLDDPFQLHLPGIDFFVALIQKFGKGCLLFKKDLRCAYCQLPVDPCNYHYLGYSFEDLLFFDTVFPFGLHTATMACQHTTSAITFLHHLQGYFSTNYVDDFGGCDTPQNAPSAYHALELLFHLLGLESAGDKDCPPSTLMIFLGILFSTLAMTMSIPAEKLSKLLTKIRKVYHQHYISWHKLQSLLGLMAFVTPCVRTAHIFMAALLNGLHSLQRSEFLCLNDEIKSDLQLWLAFLPQYNGVSLIPPSVSCADTIVTDACLIGAGGVFGNECFHTTFSDYIIEDTDYNINVKEILAIIVSLCLWASQLKGHHLLIQSNNETCVQVINSCRSHSPLLQQCLRILWLICATHDLDLQAEPIPGFLNPYADLLSRWSSDPSAQDKFFALPGTHKFHIIHECPPILFDLSFQLPTPNA